MEYTSFAITLRLGEAVPIQVLSIGQIDLVKIVRILEEHILKLKKKEKKSLKKQYKSCK